MAGHNHNDVHYISKYCQGEAPTALNDDILSRFPFKPTTQGSYTLKINITLLSKAKIKFTLSIMAHKFGIGFFRNIIRNDNRGLMRGYVLFQRDS